MTKKLHQIYAGVDLNNPEVFKNYVFHERKQFNKHIHTLLAGKNINTFAQLGILINSEEFLTNHVPGIGSEIYSCLIGVAEAVQISIEDTHTEVAKIIFVSSGDNSFNSRVQKAIKKAQITTVQELKDILENGNVAGIGLASKEKILDQLKELGTGE